MAQALDDQFLLYVHPERAHAGTSAQLDGTVHRVHTALRGCADSPLFEDDRVHTRVVPERVGEALWRLDTGPAALFK
jgi:hypothetical protein